MEVREANTETPEEADVAAQVVLEIQPAATGLRVAMAIMLLAGLAMVAGDQSGSNQRMSLSSNPAISYSTCFFDFDDCLPKLFNFA